MKNLRSVGVGVVTLGVCLASQMAGAVELQNRQRHQIEIGGGATFSTERDGRFLFLVKFKETRTYEDMPRVLLAEVIFRDGWFRSLSDSKASYPGLIELGFRGLGLESEIDSESLAGAWGVNLVGAKITRDLTVGQDLTATVSLIGVNGAVALKDGNFASFVRMSLNLLGAGISRSVAGSSTSGQAFDASIAVGMAWGKRFLIEGEIAGSAVEGSPRDQYVGDYCTNKRTDNGDRVYDYTYCGPHYDTVYDRSQDRWHAVLRSVFALTSRIKLFAEGGAYSFNVYEIETGNDSQNTARATIGLTVDFGK